MKISQNHPVLDSVKKSGGGSVRKSNSVAAKLILKLHHSRVFKTSWLSNNRFLVLAGNELHVFEGDNEIQLVGFTDVEGVVSDVCFSQEFNGFVTVTES